ncbi:ricin-type beta-trefoil lectin domain protein [Pseudonocardia sp. CA-107938]|uniref:ricin-type beta-trefoil lectin domain protein n=1 Tax=Pseudonocardia sp. CA-107938 TaxID=3240021 RepID=UPI003D8F4439
MTPPWSPEPAGGDDQYRRTSQIVIGVDSGGRPSVTLDGRPLDVDGGWQAAVDAGFAQVAATAERIGEPISVTVIDTASDWTGRFVVQADRSIAEDVTPPPPVRRRRGPFLALLAAAAVLVAGSAIVIGTQPRSADQPLAAPPAPTSAPTAAPTAAPTTARAAPASPTLPPPTLPPPSATQPTLPPPPTTAAPAPVAPQPKPAGPQAPRATAAPRAAPKPSPAAPKPKPAQQPPTKPAPKTAPKPAPQPAPPPAPQGIRGRVIDGLGTCLSASATTLGSGACLRNRPDQIWTQTASGQLVTGGGCLTAVAPQALAVQPCRPGDATQQWRLGGRMIVNGSTGECALVRPPDGRPVAGTVRCGTGKDPTAQFVTSS